MIPAPNWKPRQVYSSWIRLNDSERERVSPVSEVSARLYWAVSWNPQWETAIVASPLHDVALWR